MTGKKITIACTALVHEEGGCMHHTCNRPLVDKTGCRIHCDAAHKKRRAAAAARYEAKMKPKYKAWANESLGAKVRDIMANVRPGECYQRILDAISEVDHDA